MTGQSDNLKKDTPMKTKRRALAAAFAAVLLAIPTTSAIAVNVSSGQGSGYQVATKSWSNGKTVNGSLRSYYGAPVFYSGRVNLRNGGGSTGAMRYTENVTRRSAKRLEEPSPVSSDAGPLCPVYNHESATTGPTCQMTAAPLAQVTESR